MKTDGSIGVDICVYLQLWTGNLAVQDCVPKARVCMVTSYSDKSLNYQRHYLRFGIHSDQL